MLYFDYCATTPLDRRVARLMADVNDRVFGNPSSIHRFGKKDADTLVDAMTGHIRKLSEMVHA